MRISGLVPAALAVVGLGIAAVPARAMDIVASADVPFSFSAGSTALPAGHYELTTLGTPDDGVLALRNLDTRKVVLVGYVTRTAWREDEKSGFVFDKVGRERVLREIRLSDADGYVLESAARSPRGRVLAQATRHE
jgi:hypothetical protein